MITAHDASTYFLATFDGDGGDNISPLKLQKLLYYAQAVHLCLNAGKPFFFDSFVAWDHGPAVPEIYFQYESYGWRAIDRPSHFDVFEFAPEHREILDIVLGTYGEFSATRLEKMTHQEDPWKEAYRNRTISTVLMWQYFSPMAQAGLSGQAVGKHPVWPMEEFRHQQRVEITDRFKNLKYKLDRVAKPLGFEPDPWD